MKLSGERPIDALEAEEAGTEWADHDFAFDITVPICR